MSSSKKVNYNVVGLFNNVPHPFLIAKAKDILFDGVDFDCGKTMTRKTICLVLKDDATELKALDDRGMKFKFSLFGNVRFSNFSFAKRYISNLLEKCHWR